MSKRILAVAAVFSGSLLCTPFTGSAQEDPDSTIRSLDEVNVTANKYPNKTSLTGKVVTIITREEIERSSARDLSQLLSIHSGLLITGANGSPGKDKTVFLRGAAAEYTLITIDGIPVYDPSGIGGHFDIRNLSLVNIERIEILKGSQSTLYGSDAIAGVINIITKKSTSRPLAFDAMTTVGSNETFKLSTGIRGKKENLDYNVSYALHTTGGINDAARGPGSGPFDRDGFTQHTAEAGLGLKVSGKINIRPFVRFGYHEGDIDDGAFADELDFTYVQKSLQAGIRNEILVGKGKLSFIYNYNLIDRLYTDDSVLSINGFDTYSKGIYQGSEHFIDAYLHMPVNQQLKFTGGVDFRSSVSDQEYRSIGSWPYTSVYGSDSLNQNQFSLYGAFNWDHPGDFHLEAGTRLNLHSEYGSKLVFNFNPSYLWDKKWKFFANLSSGYRTPSLYQLYSEFGNKDLEPESSLSVEGGVQYFSANHRFTARAIAFKRNIDDVLFFHTDPGTFKSSYINQDKQRDHGFELEASIRIGKNTAIRGYYNYTKGRIETKVNGKDSSYNNLLRRPESNFGISASSRVGKRFSFSTNLSWIGKRKDLYFDPFLFTTVKTDLKAYALWDLYLEYGFVKEKLKVFVDLRNITDTDHTEISGFNTMGFNSYLGVRLSL